MARQLLFFGVLVVIFAVSQLTEQQDLENAIQKTNESSIIPNSITKSKTLQDYQTKYTAYKDLIESRCLLERFSEDNLTNNNIQKNGKNNSPKILYMSKRLSKREIYRLAGSRISEFCKGFPTYLINEITSTDDNMEGYLNDLPDDDEISMEKVRIKRESPRHYFVGRIRGQTQSQYLNFGKGAGNNDVGGKAEAESSDQGSKAVVSGSSGMGQAQSQSLPAGCEGCPGYGSSLFDQEQVLQLGREQGKPGYLPPGEIRRPYDSSGNLGQSGIGNAAGGQYGTSPQQIGGQTGRHDGRTGVSDQNRQVGQPGGTFDQTGNGPQGPGGTLAYGSGSGGQPGGATLSYQPHQGGGHPGGADTSFYPSTQHNGHSGGIGYQPIHQGGQPIRPAISSYQPNQQGGPLGGSATSPYQPDQQSGHPGGSATLPYQPGQQGGQIGSQTPIGGQTGYPQQIGIGADGKPISSGLGGGDGRHPITQSQTPIGSHRQPVPGQGHYLPGPADGQVGQLATYPSGTGDGRYITTQRFQNGQPSAQGQVSGAQSIGGKQEGSFHGHLSGGFESHRGTSGKFSGTFSGKYEAQEHGTIPGEIRDHRILTNGQSGQQGGINQQTYNQGGIGTGQFPSGNGQQIHYPSSRVYGPAASGPTHEGLTPYQINEQRPVSTGSTSPTQYGIQQGQYADPQPGVDGGVYNTGQYSPTGQTKPIYQTGGGTAQHGTPGVIQPSTLSGIGQPGLNQYGSQQYGRIPTDSTGSHYLPTHDGTHQQGGGQYGQVGGGYPQQGPGYNEQIGSQRGTPGRGQYYQPGGQISPPGSISYQPTGGQRIASGLGQYDQTGQRIPTGSGQYGQIGEHYGPGAIPGGQYGPSVGTPQHVSGGAGGIDQYGTTSGNIQPGLPQRGAGQYQGGSGPDSNLGGGQYSPQSQYNQIGSGYVPSQQGQTGGYYGNVVPGNLERRPDGEAGLHVSGDDSDSQVQASVQQSNNETLANAQAQGKYLGGTAQSQVSGTYSGSGSFSASAGSDDGKRGALTQVSGGKSGAQSSAQGRGGKGQSQAQVVLSSETGDTVASAQSGGHQHGTQSQVQANNKGGMADAQANGPGSTSSQAQIGFTPYDEHEKDDQRTPFRGGGTASAQGGTYSGLTQSQIQGQFQKGIRYTGSAQAGSGAQGINWNITRPQGFQPFKPIRFSNKTSINTQKQVTALKVNDAVHLEKKNNIPMESADSHVRDSRRSSSTSTISTTTEEDPTTIPNEDYDEEDYEDYEDTTVKTRSIITQDSKNQKQHIILDPLENLDATVYQSKGDNFPADGTILQPGQTIPGSPGYQIPQGFRGRVKSIASGSKTYAIGKNSQAQSVYLTPGTGRIYYKKPIYAASSKTLLRNGRYAYGSGYSFQPAQYAIKTAKSLPNFVSSIRSESGYRDLKTGEKSPNVYYTQSSTCGMFTHTCIFKDGKKLCMPRLKTNPSGLPVGC